MRIADDGDSTVFQKWEQVVTDFNRVLNKIFFRFFILFKYDFIQACELKLWMDRFGVAYDLRICAFGPVHMEFKTDKRYLSQCALENR